MSSVVALPPRRLAQGPVTAVRVGHDFGSWCVELYRAHRWAHRRYVTSEAAARSEAARLALTGLKLLPDAPSVSAALLRAIWGPA